MRLIIATKSSQFSAPLGATGRAAVGSEIVPSARPLIIWKYNFLSTGNLLISSLQTWASCMAFFLH